MLNISGLSNGVVLDHIPAGKSMDIYHYLGLNHFDSQVAIIKNVKSNKMGKKDIIKIEGTLEDINLDVLGFVDPNITVNIIRDNQIVEKKKLQLPERLTNVIKCRNPRCITSMEQELPQVFFLSDKDKKIYRCLYCEEKYDGRNKKRHP
jgi:aspartate carbamoyltransferase regulatory subunit